MSFWSRFGSVGKTVLLDAEKVVVAGAPIAATAFGGPGAGTLIQSVIDSIHGMAQTGVTPNKALLTASIGQIIEGAIGVLQATGKLPSLDVPPPVQVGGSTSNSQGLVAPKASTSPMFPSTKV